MCLLTLGKTCTVTLYFACGSNLDLKLNSTDEDASEIRAFASPLSDANAACDPWSRNAWNCSVKPAVLNKRTILSTYYAFHIRSGNKRIFPSRLSQMNHSFLSLHVSQYCLLARGCSKQCHSPTAVPQVIS